MDRSRRLFRLPFELAYLALLTSYRIKPLSRWESGLHDRDIDALVGLGLEIAKIHRYTLLGRRISRVVFSRSPRYLEGYRNRFDGRRLGRSRADVKLEGWFFGYPSCCVDLFARKPYFPNGLPKNDQRILFHWACPGCAGTESLLREYRLIYEECVRIMGYEPERNGLIGGSGAARRSNLGRAIPWAASIAALAILHGFGSASESDPHVLPAPDDSDGDGLTYAEERLLGTCPYLDDVDGNVILDGIEASAALYAMITALPTAPVPDGPYALEVPMDGLEQCAVCGVWVNMGYYRIIHPVRGIEAELPVIGLHYLEHGSVGYDGSEHGLGRADIDGLKRVLFPSNPAHIYSRLGDDIDEDKLFDEEEPLLGTDPQDPDTDDDSLEDAPQVAERLLSAISTLPREERSDGPYIVDHVERGIETCWLCGDEMDMGFLEIVNPLEGLSFTINYISLHYMAHGGFSALGDVHFLEYTLPTVIDFMLNGTGNSHRFPVEGDWDSDGLADDEETALGIDPHNPDCDLDGIPDGPDLALSLHDRIAKLPTHDPVDPPPTHHVYVVHYEMLGSFPCLVCGKGCNMGYMDIIDPVADKNMFLGYYAYHFMEHGSFSTDRGRIDVEALVDVLGVSVAGGGIPGPGHAMLSNAPNPFTAWTRISLYMPSTADIEVAVFDVAGRKVCDLYSGEAAVGTNEFLWDGRDPSGRELTAGVYFCKIRFGSMSVSKKILKIE